MTIDSNNSSNFPQFAAAVIKEEEQQQFGMMMTLQPGTTAQELQECNQKGEEEAADID